MSRTPTKMKSEVARVKAERPELPHREAFKMAAENWQTSPTNPQNGGELSIGRPPAPTSREGGAHEFPELPNPAAAKLLATGSAPCSIPIDVSECLQRVPDTRVDMSVPTEADGYKLHMSGKNKTGYRKVYLKKHDEDQPMPYTAEDDENYAIGRFRTAVEAAVAYAKYKLGDGERERIAREAVVSLLEDNGKEGIERRWLAKVSADYSSAMLSASGGGHGARSKGTAHDTPCGCAWLPLRALPPALVTAYEAQALERYNRTVEGALGTAHTSLGETGVEPIHVDKQLADACASYLRANWLADGTCAVGRQQLLGYSTYGKVLGVHNAEQQRTHTLLITPATLPMVRAHLAGFARMEEDLSSWLHVRFGTHVELVFAHGLRQSPATLPSTGFDVHQVSASECLGVPQSAS